MKSKFLLVAALSAILAASSSPVLAQTALFDPQATDPAAHTVTPVPQASQAQLAAIARMLRAMKVEKFGAIRIHDDLKKVFGDDPYGPQFVAEVCPQEWIDTFPEKYAPAIAQYLSESDAATIANFFNSSAGKKVINAKLEAAQRGSIASAKAPILNAEESIVARKYANSAAAKAYMSHSLEIERAVATLGEKLGHDRIIELAQQARSRFAEMSDSEIDASLEQFKSGVVKLTALEHLAAISVRSERNMDKLEQQVKSEFLAADFKGLFKPENLATQEALESSRNRVNRVAASTNQFAADAFREADNLQAELQAAAAPAVFKERIFSSMAPKTVREKSEAIASLGYLNDVFRIYLKLIDFTESRSGKFEFKDEKLLFSDKADLEQFNLITAELQEKARSQPSGAKS